MTRAGSSEPVLAIDRFVATVDEFLDGMETRSGHPRRDCFVGCDYLAANHGQPVVVAGYRAVDQRRSVLG